jgi:hypothetical protein
VVVRIRAKRVSWLLAGWAMTLVLAGTVLAALRPDQTYKNAHSLYDFVTLIGGTIALSALGGIVASRQPRNPIGWAMLSTGLSIGYTALAIEYTVRNFVIDPGSLPFAVWAAWLADSTNFVVAWVPILLVPYLFPTGRLVSKRWLPGLALGVFGVVTLGVATAFGPELMTDYVDHLKNPLATPGTTTFIDRVIGPITPVLWFLPFISLAIGAASLIVRFRRARGVERQQMKWVAFSGLFVVLGGVLMILNALFRLEPNAISGALVVIGMGSMPLTVSVAILKYRLYDVDRLIRRTVSYALVTVTLAGIYAVIVLTPALVIGSGEIPDGLVAAGTLFAAAAFVPVRRRAQRIVDRRFNRLRFDAAQTIERFGFHLRQEIDIDALGAELESVVNQTMQPRSVGLWLRPSAART